MQRLLSIIFSIILGVGSMVAQFGLLEANPAPNSGIQYLQEVTLVFDLAQVKQDNPSVSTWYIGANVIPGLFSIDLMKGSEIVAQITDDVNLVEGDAFTIKFDNPVILESGVEYSLVIPAFCFSLFTENNWSGYLTDCTDISIKYFGEAGSEKILSLDSVYPENGTVLSEINDVVFNFNELIELSPNPKANLVSKSDGEILATSDVVLSEGEKSVVLEFENVTLYNTHNYYVEIPENTVFLKGESENGYQTITINYSGSSYKTFGYSLVSPSYNKRVDNLGRVAVTLDCTEQEYLGRDFKAQAQLYKVEDDETLTPVGDPIACATSESTRGFYVDVYNFNLEPSSVYKIVVEEGQFHLWNTETQKPLHDTANERMEFQYRTPDEIEPMPTQAFGAATPGEAESPEKLTAFRLDFEQYVYDSQFYYPVFVSYDANTLSVVDKTTGENVAEFAVDIKWDNMNNYWLENVDPLDVTMLEGHEYEVTVPAGMFCCRFDPLKEVSMNEAYTVAYKGGYATSFTLTYAVEGQATLVTEVARDSEVTVSFPENDGFKVVAIAFNGEEQEVDGSFTTPAISEDSVLDIAYEYASEIDYNFTTGIALPEDCPFSVRSEGSILIISGVQPGDTVSIYSIGGLLMANLGVVPDKTKEVCFTLDNDKVYIVRINNKTLKIQH